MSKRLGFILATFSIVSVTLFYLSGTAIVQTLSPQGCRMSWMSPSYVKQSHFNRTWSPLADRYSLWLYREVGWESTQLHGSPVLFIPGNAGSSHQVRSIASSATRQYYTAPSEVAQEFKSTPHEALDFFAVEFNEDLSAFHGPTLDSEAAYTSRAIDYILSLYKEPTSVLVLGHSMGGIVATALLPHPNISAIVTMSTPHTLPPARLDARVDRIYSAGRETLAMDSTPILSLCGGATDLMIPSESCILPSSNSSSLYRKTVFTSALEGSWTGVGHREMVWCHQVRWRIARAALDIAAARSLDERVLALDKWLRDGHTLPPTLPISLPLSESPSNILSQEYERLPLGLDLVLKQPRGSHVYLLPVPSASANGNAKFVLYVSRGSIASIAPHHALPLSVSVSLCGSRMECAPVTPSVLKLIPNPVPGQSFPVPGEGTDESEGAVLFEAIVPASKDEDDTTIAVTIDNADGDSRGWVVGGWIEEEPLRNDVSTLGLLFSATSIHLPHRPIRLHAEIEFPNLLSSSLVVYRLIPVFEDSKSCIHALLPPLLQHTSHPSETHYFPLSPDAARPSPILLHSHASGPFIPRTTPLRGFKLKMYASGECSPSYLTLQVDWWGTIGRWGTRYVPAVLSWAVTIVALVIFDAYSEFDISGSMATVPTSLARFSHRRLIWLLIASVMISFLPLPNVFWLGNGGEAVFAPLAPLLLVIATGLVWIVWWLITGSLHIFSRLLKLFGRRGDDRTLRRHAFLSLALVCLLIFLLIPWQVAFLGCWIFHFYTCAVGLATAPDDLSATSTTQTLPLDSPSISIPLEQRKFDDTDEDDTSSASTISAHRAIMNAYKQDVAFLFLMTWLLPFAAPVLAVWVRTVATAGLTTPFDGDHNFLRVLPFLLMTEVASANSGRSGEMIQKSSRAGQRFFLRCSILASAFFMFFTGPGTAYTVLDSATMLTTALFVLRVRISV